MRLAAAATVTSGLLALAACSDTTNVVAVKGALETQEEVDFRDVQVGIEMPYELVVKNVGDGSFSITGIEAGDGMCASDYEFKIDGSCEAQTLADKSINLPAQTARTLRVTFQPFTAMENPVEASIRLLTNIKDDAGSNITFTVRLIGRGVTSGIEVVPNPVDFGKVLVGSSRTLEVQVYNRLGVAVDLTTRLGSNGKPEIVNQGGLGRFELLEPTPDAARNGSLLPADTLLEPDASITVRLRYVPDVAAEGREDRGRWTIANCDSSLCDLDVTLLGRGTNAAIECDPPAVDFGQVNPGVTSTQRTTCTNAASEAVTVLGWSMGVASAPEYSVVPYNGQVTNLGPGESFDVEVQFAPTAASIGTDPTGAVVVRGRNPIAGRDLDELRVELLGEAGGPDIQVTPESLNFGRVAIGTSSKRRILVENTGYNDLEITDINSDTGGTGAYAADRDAFVVRPGQSQVVEVTYTPTVEGEVTSTLLISSNDSDEGSYTVTLVGQGVNLPPCSFTLQPVAVNFGIVQVLRSTTQGVRIENIGADACLINDVEIAAGSDPDFGLVDGSETNILLAAGDTKTILVSYTPGGEATHTGELTFYISDPNNPNPAVSLHGVGSASALLISPNEIDFGQIGVNCATRERTVSIYNTGSTATSITRIELPAGVSGEFELSSVPNLPASIPPGQSIEVGVRYRASDVGQDTGFFHIYEGSRTDPYVVPLFGSGDLDPINEDRFQQLETPEVDILFVIDNSCSMSEEQASLTANFQSFIQFADAQALDYRIAVVTTDVDGCPNPTSPQRPVTLNQGQCGYFADGNGDNTLRDPSWRLITPDEQPSAETAFSAIATQGINGSGSERGLEAAYQALSSPIITGWNNGFLRPSAYLALIFVSDEEDQSANAVDFYVNYFLAIKGFRNTNLFSASAIVGDAPSGCGGFQAEAGVRYIDMADRTGGIFESICTGDWGSSLQNLGLSVFGYKSRFFLSNQPVAGTVEVTVDGVPVAPTAPSGQIRWSYDTPTNTVNFAPLAIPEPGSEIVVTYRPECL
ncbi:MAG: choice-of-anchor D domain-containing protein [Myxococcales bacterium]|nr:choice-of-anchor D domain-containing protein [Myxococcales bacterium]